MKLNKILKISKTSQTVDQKLIGVIERACENIVGLTPKTIRLLPNWHHEQNLVIVTINGSLYAEFGLEYDLNTGLFAYGYCGITDERCNWNKETKRFYKLIKNVNQEMLKIVKSGALSCALK